MKLEKVKLKQRYLKEKIKIRNQISLKQIKL